MNRVIALLVVAAFLSVLTVGCVSQEKEVLKSLDNPNPINCATAEADIRVLESEKEHVAKQIAVGITSIVPAGAVVGILTGKEMTKLKIGIGEYNRKIDARIAEIKAHCGLE